MFRQMYSRIPVGPVSLSCDQGGGHKEANRGQNCRPHSAPHPVYYCRLCWTLSTVLSYRYEYWTKLGWTDFGLLSFIADMFQTFLSNKIMIWSKRAVGFIFKNHYAWNKNKIKNCSILLYNTTISYEEQLKKFDSRVKSLSDFISRVLTKTFLAIWRIRSHCFMMMWIQVQSRIWSWIWIVL